MSIKGTDQELYVGKTESNIISFLGKKTTIVYSELDRIDFSYFRPGRGGGYLDFIDKTGGKKRFSFNHKANKKIHQTIELIKESRPELEITEYHAEDYKFYQCDWFIILTMFFCCMPLGLLLMWRYKKYTLPIRAMMTFLIIALWFPGAYYLSTLQATTPPASSLAQSEITDISPEELITNYEANEVKGDEIYSGKYFRLTGTIGDIGKDILENVYITFKRDEPFAITSVQCYFNDDAEIQKVMDLNSGDNITLVGYCEGKFGNVQIKDCIIEESNVSVKANTKKSGKDTEGLSTTLTAGHYVVGIDIPIGTYSFFSKKGTGNLYSNNGAINEIFDYENQAGESLKEYGVENFGTEELKNIYLSEGVVVTVTGTQEISAGCDDGLVSSMTNRNQDELEELEIGYGNYGANDNIPSGTYNIIWLEGSGNIISDSANTDNSINEIMGNPDKLDTGNEFDATLNKITDELYIQEFHNFTIEEGDILKIPDIKVRLVPSK